MLLVKAPVTVAGPCCGLGRQRHGGIGVDIPDHTILGGIGYAQADDRAIAHGGRLRNVRDRLRGDRRQNQGSERDIIAVGCAGGIRGVGAHMIKRAGRQPGDEAGKGTSHGDGSIRGLVIRDGRVGRSAPDHAMFGRVG